MKHEGRKAKPEENGSRTTAKALSTWPVATAKVAAIAHLRRTVRAQRGTVRVQRGNGRVQRGTERAQRGRGQMQRVTNRVQRGTGGGWGGQRSN